MKKFNKRNVSKKANAEKVNKKLKNKLGNLEIKPQFLIIGLVVIITIISLIYFIFLKYSPIMNFKYEGYAVSGKEITENLAGEGKSNADKEKNANQVIELKNMELVKIGEEETIFKKLNKYYVGNKEKKEIDLNYPIYINDKSTIYNLSQDITLISKDFEKVAGYPNISISDGKVYNGNSLERADGKEYIFAKTKDNIYINLKEMKIESVANEYVIPINSFIAFEEDVIRYYSAEDDTLTFKEINDVDYKSQVIIKNIEDNTQSNVQKVDNTYNYEELLTKLEIIENAKNDVENSQEKIEKEETFNEEEQIDEKEENKEEVREPIVPENSEEIQDNTEFVKPEVTAGEFKAEVYTAKSRLHIKDPAGRIIEAPTFEIYKDGKIYLRRIFKASGEIQITGLVPDTEYEIVGKYIYLNEENKKIENTFYKGTIKTKGYEALGAITLTKEEGEIFSNKIQIKNLKITSDINAEEVKGINQVEIETGEIKTVIKNDKVNELLQGKEVTIESSEGLKSNATVGYKIRFYDKNGKELKVENNEGKSKTSKQKPTVKVAIKEQDIVSVTLGLRLTNKDKVKLENYKYVVTKPNGEIVKEERLSENEREIKLEDLDQNQYYKITIYADFNLNDNKGVKEKEEIGNLVFATKPIATLGSLELKVENKETTNKSAKIEYRIDEERTDKRLIQILNELTIKIVEASENSENNTNENKDNKDTEIKEESSSKTGSTEHKNTEEVVYTNMLAGEEIEKLKLGETKVINYEPLKSNTIYKIEITGNVELGNTKEEIPVTYTYNRFITLKIPAKVEIKNQFVTGNLIDLDVKVEDKDNSVLNNKVRVELRDEKNNLIDLQEIETNKEYVRKTYEKLEENKTYTLSFYADQYNEGSTDETYKINYLIKRVEIITEPGISGEIGLTELSRKATGKNLVDMSSENKWRIYPIFDTYNNVKEYNEETGILRLGKDGHWRPIVYDLTEYAGKEVTMSFKARAVNGTQDVYIQNNKDTIDWQIKLKDLTEEWKEYQYTLKIDSTGYLGFYIAGGNGIEVKDLQIELGSKKTPYEEFKYNLQSSYSVNLEDKKDEITTNDYYLKIYEDGNLIKTDRYEEITEENAIENAIKTYNVQSKKDYVVELVVKIRDREYTLSKLEYNTKEAEELNGIHSKEEFLEIQPRGNYIILNDIDLTGRKSTECYYALEFEGKINFNGKKLKLDYKDVNYPIFSIIGKQGRIENLELDIFFNNSVEKSNIRGLFHTNYGTIKNIKVNILETIKVPNFSIHILGNTNRGIIENFVIKFEQSIYATNEIDSIALNYGTIKNGYLYGENIQETFKAPGVAKKLGAPLVSQNNGNGTIKNIYSLVSVDTDIESNVSNLIQNNTGNATVENVYSVGIGNMYNVNFGPNIYGTNSSNIKNNYYFTDEVFKNKYHTTTTKLALHDANFQNKLLNQEKAFIVDELIEKGYYPWVEFPECMPKQEYIKLPEVQDKDLPDILSTDLLEQGTDKVKIKIIVNNPSADQVTDIKIKDINTKILEQKYDNGKSEVIVELYNPIRYISSYSLQSITTKGAFNMPYTRSFKENERKIEVDLYREINNVEGWKNINKLPAENYILMNDLDFLNEANSINITNRYTGKIEGNNHTIKNIILAKGFLFNDFNGILENINIQNFQVSKNNDENYFGLINIAQEAVLDNVHINDVHIQDATNNSFYVGTLIAKAENSTIVKNCSANNIKIEKKGNASEVQIGGLIGISSRAEVTNSYVGNINITAKEAVSQNIGGLIGQTNNSKVNNCYVSVGEINGEKRGLGGLVGIANSTVDLEISNCYSNVTINSLEDNIGGIVGMTTGTGTINICNNISFGDIYSNKNSTNISRIVGNNLEYENNYAFNKQKVNGFITKKSLGASLLNYTELCKKETYENKINLGDGYNYSQVEQGILPILYDLEEKEILPNQQKIEIDKNSKIELENIIYEKISNNKVSILMEFYNPNNFKITEVEIENMEVRIIKNTSKEDKTYIQVEGSPTKYYDSYKISKIIYEDNGEKEEEISAKIDIQFYKELYNYSDWQQIEKGTYQNYKLASDIDFANKTDINKGITMARLESDGHTLKNITITDNNNFCSLITELTTSLIGINFENIIINASSQKNAGVISNSTADIKNVNFKDITINAENATNVGCIATSSGNINNINLENIIINGDSYVGGLVGKQNGYLLENILGNNIHVKAKGNYAGGIIGMYSQDKETPVNKINIENSNVKGMDYVGGVAGKSNIRLRYAKAEQIEVRGNNYVGGLIGHLYYLNNGKMTFGEVLNSYIYGTAVYIGGLIGRADVGAENNLVKGTKIVGEENNSTSIGGLTGYMNDYRFYKNAIVDCDILTKGSEAGGLIGTIGASGDEVSSNYIYNVKVEAYSKAGGICGKAIEIALGIYNNLINVDILVTNSSAGGIIGHMENIAMNAATKKIVFYRNIVADSKLSGKTKIGGLVGDIDVELYEAPNTKFYYNNYVHAELKSEDDERVSMGVGANKTNNSRIQNTNIYKFGKVNNVYASEFSDTFEKTQYISSEELKLENTYKNKFGFESNFDYTSLKNNKYPLVIGLEGQEGVNLPEDKNYIESTVNMTNKDKLEYIETETPHYTFNYNGKIIKTYETYSEIESEDGSRVVRQDLLLYVKDGKLYALPVSLELKNSDIKFVPNNFIIDSYNGKEYETVLGIDGKLYDLKEALEYPENFVNKDIVRIGNNLNNTYSEKAENISNKESMGEMTENSEHGIEVTYKNGDKVRFNYQTGEIIDFAKKEKHNKSISNDSEEKGLLEYVQEKFSKIGNYTNTDKKNIEMQDKYEETIKLQNKLEEIPVEEALKKESKENESKENNMDFNAETEKEEANNSLKEKKYISIYNAEKDDYQIYQEEELLDTSKQEVISENEKIEANKLNKYYASEEKATNTKMGIVWIALSIVGVITILFVMNKRESLSNIIKR